MQQTHVFGLMRGEDIGHERAGEADDENDDPESRVNLYHLLHVFRKRKIGAYLHLFPGCEA